MPTFRELRDLPWYTWVDDNNKILIETMLKDMLLDDQVFKNSEVQQLYKVPLDGWYLETIYQNDTLCFLPSKDIDGITRNHVVSKLEMANSIFSKIDKSKFDSTHYQLSKFS